MSVSKESKDIERYGATAIRLAMIIGGIVDVQDVLDTQGPSKSLATAWNSPKAAEELKQILGRFTEVRIHGFSLLKHSCLHFEGICLGVI